LESRSIYYQVRYRLQKVGMVHVTYLRENLQLIVPPYGDIARAENAKGSLRTGRFTTVSAIDGHNKPQDIRAESHTGNSNI
jgi:hypothetical protein